MNYKNLIIFFRNYRKHKVITTINIAGLSIGMLSALFIFEYVFFERSFDRYHEYAGQVYRIVYNRYQDEQLQWETANCYFPTGKWLKENYDEVLDWAVLSRKYNIMVSCENPVGDKVMFHEEKTYYSSSSLFNLFTIPLLEGTKSCLEQPGTVAVSKRAARKYFGNENPLGKTLTVNSTERYTVTAVFSDIPANSHLKTDFLFSLPTYTSQNQWILNNWGYDYFHTYVKLASGTNYEEFCKRAMPQMIAKNYASTLESSNSRDEFFFQPLTDIHLFSNIEYETEPPGNAKTNQILFGFALFLLVVAWINNVNLVAAQSLDRAKEIAIKKINGARKTGLTRQFISEAFVFNTVCLIISLALFFVLNPVFKSVTGITNFSLFAYKDFVIIGLLVFLLGVFLSAVYPAFVLSSYRPGTALKGKFKNSAEGLMFRKVLITVQFIISLCLLTGTLVTFSQASFLTEKDMGVDYKSGLIIRAARNGETTETLMNKLMLFKEYVSTLPEVENFSFTSDIPGEEINHWIAGRRKGYERNDGKAYFQLGVDDQFIDFYNVRIIAGRKFHDNESPGLRTLLMNKKAVERFGYSNPEEALDKIMVTGNDQEWRVVGVVDDFHFKSVKVQPVPTIITLNDGIKEFVNIKLRDSSSKTYESVLPKLQSGFKNIFEDQPFEYFTLDNKIMIDLRPDKTFATVFMIFSGLSVFIAIIGIFGLILITIKQNLKELGIRKALGAGMREVSAVLSKQLVVQFLVALALAVPLSYYGYQNWFLNSYIYRISLNVWFFTAPVLLMFSVVFTVILVLSNYVNRMKASGILQNE